MSGAAEDEIAGQLLADQFVKRLREERAARPGHSALFPRLGDAAARRQVVRWIGREYREATPGIIETLRSALDDDDWEVRASAMLVAARLRVVQLRSAVNEVALPSAHQHGLDERDARLLVAVRIIAAESLAVAGEGDVAGAIDHQLAGLPPGLARLVLGHEPDRRDRTWLLLHALAAPLELEDPLPDPPPPGIAIHDRRAILGGAAVMAWVSPVPHILGDEAADAAIASPIREHAPAGFFVARRPLSAEALNRLGVDPPQQATAHDPATAARLACTPDAPLIVAHEDAVALCDAIARRTGARVMLPTADELECAARGTDGRRYPWGNGLQRLQDGDRSPHGMERFAVPVAQWTSSCDPSGVPLVLGGPGSPRCSGRLRGTGGYAVRPLVRVPADAT